LLLTISLPESLSEADFEEATLLLLTVEEFEGPLLLVIVANNLFTLVF